MRRSLAGSACLVLAAALGCSWVALSPEAGTVRVAALDDVGECKRIAKTTSTVASKLWFVSRSQEKVDSELETLARNAAAREGGDTVAPLSNAREGSREFAIYSCAASEPRDESR